MSLGGRIPTDDSELERIHLRSSDQAKFRALGFLLQETLQGGIYFLSFLPFLLLLSHFRSAHPAVLLFLAIVSFYLAGILFLSLLIITKRIVVSSLETDRVVSIETSLAKRLMFASMLNGMMIASPFRSIISGLSPFTSYYYRGMGAKMARTVFISARVRIADPWFIEIQENATIGGEALILGHAGDGPKIILGSVFIGEGAIIGGRSIILPNVRIGSHARVGAGAVVVRETVIPDGETWAGVPARKISPQIRVTGL